MISQFTPTVRPTALAEFKFPKDVYAIGRLDADSEICSCSTSSRIERAPHSIPRAHRRTYWAQVERIPTAESPAPRPRRHHPPHPAVSRVASGSPTRRYAARPPIRYRKTCPTAGSPSIEGNRQVRRMTAAITDPAPPAREDERQSRRNSRQPMARSPARPARAFRSDRANSFRRAISATPAGNRFEKGKSKPVPRENGPHFVMQVSRQQPSYFVRFVSLHALI